MFGFNIFLKKNNEWVPLVYVPSSMYFVEKRYDISLAVGTNTRNVTLKIVSNGGKTAHVDAISLAGVYPCVVRGTIDPILDLKKLQAIDNDLVDVTGREVEIDFVIEYAGLRELFVLARIPEVLFVEIPFSFPPSNLYKKISKDSEFYEYVLEDNWDQLGQKTLLFREWCKCGTGHPDGYIYTWVGNDLNNLYVRMDVTPDSTQDGTDDYTTVICRLKNGIVKSFKCTTEELQWGKPEFAYTDTVNWQHNIYEFSIPLSELGIENCVLPHSIDLAFLAYGTMGPPPPIGKSIYISDTNNSRIVQRNPSDLSYISELSEFTSVTYNDPAGFTFNVGAAVDGFLGSYLFTTDISENKIIKFYKNGDSFEYVSQIGSLGTGNDEFNNPVDLTSDETYIYVVDSINNRIVKRSGTDDLSYVSQIGSLGTGNDEFSAPYGITNDITYLYVADTGNNRIVKRLASDLSYVSQIGTGPGSGDDEFNNPVGVTNDGTYLYVVDENNHRIVKRLLSDLSYVSQVGSFGVGNDEFNLPLCITTDGTYLYVVDSLNYRVVKRLSSDLSYVSQVGSNGSGPDEFTSMFGIATDGTYLYVTDNGYPRISKRLNADLSFVSQLANWNFPVFGDYAFYQPQGIASDSTHFYFVDQNGQSIVKCTKVDNIANSVFVMNTTVINGNYLSGMAPIACDGTYVYVGVLSVLYKLLASDLSFVAKIGSFGTGDDQFKTIQGITTDGTNLYITDAQGTSSGRIVKRLVSDLSYVSQVDANGRPHDIFYKDNVLYVTYDYITV